jgi:hypothetical protein
VAKLAEVSMYKRVNGPYTYKSGTGVGRKYVNLIYEDGHSGSKLYSHYIWEQTYGPVPKGMTVDHIDNDKTNDVLENLQLLTGSENARKSARFRGLAPTMFEFICPVCSKPAVRDLRDVKHNKKLGKTGPYCSRQCAGKVGDKSQSGRRKSFVKEP